MTVLEVPDREPTDGGSQFISPGRSPAPRYPAERARDITTRLDTALHLRPIRPDDARRLMDFHEQLSQHSIYRRFLFSHPRLSLAEVERFTVVDYVDRFAFVVEDGDRLVAVGRYDRSPGTVEAEVAFVVADVHQHHGIGTILLDELADVARQNEITSFVAYTLAENREMLDVFMHSGFAVRTSFEDGLVSVRFPIDT
jgi:GNAT superfamily N-acetyltransferase